MSVGIAQTRLGVGLWISLLSTWFSACEPIFVEPDAGSPDTPPAGEARPSPACDGTRPLTGSGHRQLTAKMLTREYLLHLPDARSSLPAPLVVALHGYNMSAAEHESITRMSELADRAGFVVAYPEGLGAPRNWDAGSCCAFQEAGRGDMEFMAALIDDVGASVCIDLSRVYFTGFSNGGMLSYRLACEMSERVAAVASVSGSAVIDLGQCRPAHAIPLMHVHGTADEIVPFSGGPGPDWLTPWGQTPPVFPSVQSELTVFRSLNRCNGGGESFFARDEASCVRYRQCSEDAEVVQCTVEGGGHTWPGGAAMGFEFGAQSQAMDATAMIWDFVKKFRLP
jgi:polyhydroxybutyrate depolymerase